MSPAETCPTCQRPMPKPKDPSKADASARGKKWTRLNVVVPTQEDREALEEKLEILTARYEQATDGKVARYVLLDWILQEVIDRGIIPAEVGA